MLRPLLAAALLLLLAAPVRAAPYTAIYAFGDSLSDVGNVFTATGGALPAPLYFGIRLSLLDSFTLLDQAAANPAAFGFTNVTDPCLAGAAVCAPTRAGQNQCLFWDDLHPTAAGHAIIAAAGLALVAVRRRGYTLTTNRR